MPEDTYNIVTNGELQPGALLEQVREKLGALTKFDQNRLDKVFAGKKYVFKSNVDLETARRYQSAIENTGIQCQIEPSPSAPTAPTAPTASASAPPKLSDLPPPAGSNLFTYCPYCSRQRLGEAICITCGLNFARYNAGLELSPNIQADRKNKLSLSTLKSGKFIGLTLIAALCVIGIYYYDASPSQPLRPKPRAYIPISNKSAHLDKQPDIAIVGHYIRKGKLYVTIQNTGNTHLANRGIILETWVDGQPHHRYEMDNARTQTFRYPGRKITIPLFRHTGRRDIKIKIDSTDILQETNKENNQLEASVKFPGRLSSTDRQ